MNRREFIGTATAAVVASQVPPEVPVEKPAEMTFSTFKFVLRRNPDGTIAGVDGDFFDVQGGTWHNIGWRPLE